MSTRSIVRMSTLLGVIVLSCAALPGLLMYQDRVGFGWAGTMESPAALMEKSKYRGELTTSIGSCGSVITECTFEGAKLLTTSAECACVFRLITSKMLITQKTTSVHENTDSDLQ